MNVFELLHPDLRKVIREFGYIEPTPVQEKAIPIILEGHNVLITAPTGTGKTEAALFPLLSKLLDMKYSNKNLQGIKILYITPMRALNRDIYARISSICEKLGFKMSIRHGDTPESERRKQSEEPPHILVTTPETLQFLLVAPKMRRWLRNIRFVIVDEVHELITDKRGTQLSIALERLVELTGGFQRIGLSATVGNINIAASFIAGTYRKCKIVQISGYKDLIIRISRPRPSDEDLKICEELKIHPDVIARLRKIVEEISNRKTVLLFTNTRDTAELLGSRLRKITDQPLGVYHGSLSREGRESLEKKLRNGEIKLVIATSSLELGIDIGAIELVIQYMSPRQVTRLVQRVGRSRHRIGETSQGLVIASDLDDSLESLVIARRAVEGLLEKELEYHENALDVLAHQIIGILIESRLDNKNVDIEYIYKIIKRAHPYRNITKEDLIRVINFLQDRGYIKVENGNIQLRRGSYIYYIENASTIPDEARYDAVDIVSRRKIGELDAEFVTDIEVGTHIVLSGRVWKIVDINNKDKLVYIEPVPDIHGAIPAWIGEEIPVPHEIAREVVDLRFRIMQEPDNIEEILRRYIDSNRVIVEKDFVEYIKECIKNILNSDIELPSSSKIVIECTDKIAVVHIGLGSKGNEALGLYLTRYLNQKYLINVAYRSDPYRVILMFSRPFNPDLMLPAFKEDLSNVYRILIDAIKNSKLFRYRIVHVARRFGIIPRDKVCEVNPVKICEMFRDTIVEEETIREILVDKVDYEVLLDLINKAKSGNVQIVVVRRSELSPLALSEEALYSRLEFTVSTLPKSIIIELVKRRLEEREITLLCLKCGWTYQGKLKYVPDDLQCPKCGMRLITMLKHKDEDIDKIIRIIQKFRIKQKLTSDEEKILREIRDRANVILQYGKRGLYALSAHGVGATTAMRKILSKARADEELFMLIVEAEKDYVKTRRFWDRD